jgi:hypothetical protein
VRKMKDKAGFCQYYYGDMAQMTMQDSRTALRLRRYWWSLKKFVWRMSVLGPRSTISNSLAFISSTIPFLKPAGSVLMHRRKTPPPLRYEPLNLRPGDWVEVRSVEEIFSTLDAREKLRGLRFTPEMQRFCGRRFKVYKKLERIILEATGELRKIRSSTYVLEGVFCDGSAHGGCDRSCFCFWREEWLKRVKP